MKKLICFAAITIIFGSCTKSSTFPLPKDGSCDDCPEPPSTIEFVTIGTQDWMLKNLDVRTYRNGEPIPKVTDPNLWVGLSTGAWCWYNNDSATYGATYGKLYNWYAVNDSRGLAPAGWHIPSDVEWSTLSDFLGCDAIAGGAMKEIGTVHWITPNTGATNSSGFTGLPGGARDNRGEFSFIENDGYWWSSTTLNSTEAWSRYLGFYGGITGGTNTEKRIGLSVRCLRD
jgi:uncharacterized protein (TIGR02145 family)